MKKSTNFLLLVVTFGMLFSLNCFSQKTLKITFANDSVNRCPHPSPISEEFEFYYQALGYKNNDTIIFKIFYGDGTYNTIERFKNTLYNDNINGWFEHTYLTSGTFDVTYIIADKYGNSDTVFHPAEVILTNQCSILFAKSFVDNNSNCIFDAGDRGISFPYKLYNNGTSIFTNLNYTDNTYGISIPNNINYTVEIDTAEIRKANYVLSCPLSPMINFTATGSNTINFAVNCTNDYDLSINSSGNPFKVGNSAFIHVGVNAGSTCYAKTGAYTLNLDPRMSFVYALYPPTSGSGQTYTWDYSNLGSNKSISNMMYFNLAPSVKIGDKVCYSFSVSPTAGDINTLNNNVNLCYIVKSAWDPNYIEVYPKGEGSEGFIFANTELTYTIGFQNTGNDYARHVYILDTLDNNLDLNSLQILYSNYPMQLYIIDGKILKFDFVNIQLPDSGTNRLLSHGFVAYKINQIANLTEGTKLKSKAGIYFDYNPAVITNSTLNTIFIHESISEIKKTNDEFSIMPNPATDNITIVNKSKVPQSYEIVIKNLQGQEVLKVKSQNSKVKIIDVSGLSNGVYILTLQNEKGNYVSKVVIQK